MTVVSDNRHQVSGSDSASFLRRLVKEEREAHNLLLLATGLLRAAPDGTPRRGTGLLEDVTERKRAREERERLRLLEAASRVEAAERSRIGRELHDRVSHLPGVVHQSLELHEAFKHSDPDKAAQKMELARSTTVEAMRWTRDLSEMLRVPPSEGEMRPRLARMLSQDVPERIATHLIVEGVDLAVPPVVREQLFLVLREAVRNAVSHSGAEEVRVSVAVGRQEIVGAVEDDGRGFEQVAPEDPTRRGGLRYMTERAELHGGGCSVESVAGKGTRVVASFPLS